MTTAVRNGGRSTTRPIGRWRAGTLFVLAAYLLQFGAAIGHGAEWPEPAGGSGTASVHAASSSAHNVAPHDAATCPVCVAMCGVALIAHAPTPAPGTVEGALPSFVAAALQGAPAPAPSSRGPPVPHA